MSDIEPSHSALPALTVATLKSERMRTYCMFAVFGMIVGLAINRVINPLVEAPDMGPLLLRVTTAFVVGEVVMLLLIGRAIRNERDLHPAIWYAQIIGESAFPVLAIVLLTMTTEFSPFAFLTSAAYPMLFMISGLSVLRLEPRYAIAAGVVCTGSYASYAYYALASSEAGAINVSVIAPKSMFISLVLMLGIASLLTFFVASRVRGYVNLAVKEMDTRRRMDRIESDLALARDVQRSLLPQTVPELPGYDLAGMSRSADQTGGDYYDWQPIDDHRIVISIGDVTGHGVGPALVTAACRAYVRATVDGKSDPSVVIERVNQLLHEDMAPGRFVTFAMVQLDVLKHEAVFFAAGHGPSFFVKASGEDVTSIATQALPLGLYVGQDNEDCEVFAFGPGDVIVLFSDGFFEWQNANGDQFGTQRLEDVIHRNRHRSSQQIIDAMDETIRAFVGNQPQDDDMTAVVIKRCS